MVRPSTHPFHITTKRLHVASTYTTIYNVRVRPRLCVHSIGVGHRPRLLFTQTAQQNSARDIAKCVLHVYPDTHTQATHHYIWLCSSFYAHWFPESCTLSDSVCLVVYKLMVCVRVSLSITYLNTCVYRHPLKVITPLSFSLFLILYIYAFICLSRSRSSADSR